MLGRLALKCPLGDSLSPKAANSPLLHMSMHLPPSMEIALLDYRVFSLTYGGHEGITPTLATQTPFTCDLRHSSSSSSSSTFTSRARVLHPHLNPTALEGSHVHLNERCAAWPEKDQTWYSCISDSATGGEHDFVRNGAQW